MANSPSLKPRESELVLAVVCATGTDYRPLNAAIADHVLKFGYKVNPIKLSDFLKDPAIQRKHGVPIKVDESDEANRISSLMNAGNKVRSLSRKQDILALYAAGAIGRDRSEEGPPRKIVHLLHSLKRPEEVETLRGIYGGGFYVVGMYSSPDARLRHLHLDKHIPEETAQALIDRDQEEEDVHGQRTRSTFQMADVFVPHDGNEEKFKGYVYRFLDLVFGDPFQTPTRAEHAMFLAYAASLRSADLSRQVGAVVVSADGEVIATGANDVPSQKSGLYWSDDGLSDKRDFQRGEDSNKKAIDEIASEIAQSVCSDTEGLDIEAVKTLILQTRLSDLTEFGRAVHAEMEALMQCARVGVSPKGGTMYVTTFPCHNCAKHIIAAGIRAVFFVEPYPKSRAFELHSDAIVVEAASAGPVAFGPFAGVAARRYFDLFSMRLSSGSIAVRKDGIKKRLFEPSSAHPRVPMQMNSVSDREKLATTIVAESME